MKNLFLSLIILFSGIIQVTAQDFYLPSSSKSKKALKSMYEASELYSNVHISEGNELINKVLAEDPTLFLAYVYAVQWAGDSARTPLLEKALTIDTKDFNEAEKILRNMLENLLKDPGYKSTEAMQMLVDAYPNTPQAAEWASLHYFYTSKDVDSGLKYAQQVVKMSPKYAPIYNNLGYMHMQKNEMEKAKTALAKYISLAPNEPNAYDSMGEYYAINKDFVKAAENYDKAAEMGLDGAKELADLARSKIK